MRPKRESWQTRNRDRFNELWRNWYRENSARKMAWQERRLAELRQWWRELKATKSCDVCGERAPECLHFHHIDPKTKLFSLGEGAALGRSKKRILEEVAKCRVLCANCHLKHHWNERQKGSG